MATAAESAGRGAERAYLETIPPAGEGARLSEAESRHLLRARRVPVGGEVIVFDGRGRLATATITDEDRRGAGVVIGVEVPGRDPAIALTLYVAPPEMGRLDLLVEQCALLGVRRVVPLASARTVRGRLDQVRRRGDRLGRLAREALKVNGCAHALGIETEGVTLDALFDAAPPHLGLLAPDPTLPGLLASDMGGERSLLIGPEGGFTPEEMERAVASGVPMLRLGRPSLRIETAALCAAALLCCQGDVSGGPRFAT